MSIAVKHSIIRSTDGRIKYRIFSPGGKEHYHLGIWIEGEERELEHIVLVEYELHPSFKNRIRKSSNRKNGFSITIWTWGIFNIHIRLHDCMGKIREMDHKLAYELPPDDGKSYVQVGQTTG
ncbi:MAG: hypothetical protein K9N55_05780 [Phycisphaerae bacterium]|nr:hypothetical protein [Phycisphaerae bacterium]